MSTIILDVLTKIKCCHYNFMQLFSIQGKKYTAAIPNTDIEFFYGFDWNHYWLKAKFILSTYFCTKTPQNSHFLQTKVTHQKTSCHNKFLSLLIVTVVITIALGSILGKFVSHLISIVIGVARDILLEKSSIEY